MKKYLFGLADTEGVPHRAGSKSTLWDLCIIFTCVMESPTWDKVEDVYHVCQFTHSKWCGGGGVREPLASFKSTINHIKEIHGCDDIILCFWNAPHDRGVLRRSGFGGIYTLDMMLWHGKRKLGGTHTGLGDVLEMMKFKVDPGEIIKVVGEPKRLEQDEATTGGTRGTGRRKQAPKSTGSTRGSVEGIVSSLASMAISLAKDSSSGGHRPRDRSRVTNHGQALGVD